MTGVPTLFAHCNSKKSDSVEETTKDEETSESGNADGEYEETPGDEMNASVESAQETTIHYHHSVVENVDEDNIVKMAQADSALPYDRIQTNGSNISRREQPPLVRKSSHPLQGEIIEIYTTLTSYPNRNPKGKLRESTFPTLGISDDRVTPS
ncbi:unnamed protein product [Allacma fusca]|uniref:Uncharacterized protein n=1 Tax=Allacma fusca TaxID=39272 RepID=A0A8J2J3X5_9HEXA|nr:unnamed protein product [Allacma fusca]